MGQSEILPGIGSILPTIGQNEILPGVGSVPLTMGQSVSGVFFEVFRLWTGFSPSAYCCAFTIFSWKLGIVAMNDNTFQSRNYSVEPSF